MKRPLPLRRALALLSTLATASFFVGCQNVEPWERGTLSHYSMKTDRDPIAGHLSEHVFFTREAANGGTGVGGGGCGCN